MSKIERRRRSRCRLACEFLGKQRTRIRSNVVTLSEGGFAVETEREFEVGDAIRLCILPHRRERSVKVTGIVWNDRPSRRSAGPMRVIGCVLSDPPARFLKLLAEVEEREGPRSPGRPQAQPRSEVKRKPASRPAPVPAPPAMEPGLPRSREPLPPPKPEPEETLPHFRVRLKQIGGSRTRVFDVSAHSAARAAERAQEHVASSGTTWQVLEVVPAHKVTRPRRS